MVSGWEKNKGVRFYEKLYVFLLSVVAVWFPLVSCSFVWLCLVCGLSQLRLVVGLRMVVGLFFTGCLVVFWVVCVHNHVDATYAATGWSCVSMLKASPGSQLGLGWKKPLGFMKQVQEAKPKRSGYFLFRPCSFCLRRFLLCFFATSLSRSMPMTSQAFARRMKMSAISSASSSMFSSLAASLASETSL